MMTRSYTGADVPTLVGFRVSINHGVHVEGIIESWKKDSHSRDMYRIVFSQTTNGNRWLHGYVVEHSTPIEVLQTDDEKISELEYYLGQAIADERGTAVSYSDYKAAAAVVKAMEALINVDTKE